MTEIQTSDIGKLRKVTGAGIMHCKKALQESGGDFDSAIEIIRKKGQAIASKRADREASEGVVLAKVSPEQNKGFMIVLNCETDFVAKNEKFINLAVSILDQAIENNPDNLEGLKQLIINNTSVNDLISEQTGIIGEKLDLSYFDKIEDKKVIAYIHPGNQLATLVGINLADVDLQVGKDIAMQVAAMNPIAVDKEQIPKDIIDKEIEIGKEQAKQEGKPEQILEKIAMGKLNKFFKENTLLNQEFIKENKKSIRQYLQEYNKDLNVSGFKRFSLKD